MTISTLLLVFYITVITITIIILSSDVPKAGQNHNYAPLYSSSTPAKMIGYRATPSSLA